MRRDESNFTWKIQNINVWMSVRGEEDQRTDDTIKIWVSLEMTADRR